MISLYKNKTEQEIAKKIWVLKMSRLFNIRSGFPVFDTAKQELEIKILDQKQKEGNDVHQPPPSA